MRQLARTLLILGGVAACERAHPVVDGKERPAVGNIGQTGRPAQAQPKPAAIALPLVDASGAPAVGNIGQTGAPSTTPTRTRRVHRVQRAQRLPVQIEQPAPAAAAVRVEQPLKNRDERPMVGNVMTKGRGSHHVQESTTSAPVTAATSPLTDRRERPAVGNMGRSGRLHASDRNLRGLEEQIVAARKAVHRDPHDRDAQAYLHELVVTRDELQREMDGQ
jgi:hypothetical protein